MSDRQKLKKSTILEHERAKLHNFGFTDAEIDSMRLLITYYPWIKSERTNNLNKLKKAQTEIQNVIKSLDLIRAINPGVILDLNHISSQLTESNSPAFLECSHTFVHSLNTPEVSAEWSDLTGGIEKLNATIKHYIRSQEASILTVFAGDIIEKKLSTGKELLLQALHFHWCNKHPQDVNTRTDDFFEFVAILFMSSDNPDAKRTAPNNCKDWWHNLTEENLVKQINIHYPVNISYNEDGTKKYFRSPPTLEDIK